MKNSIYQINFAFDMQFQKPAYNAGYEENVFDVITVILLPDKLKYFNRKYLLRLSSVIANKRLFAILMISICGAASNI